MSLNDKFVPKSAKAVKTDVVSEEVSVEEKPLKAKKVKAAKVPLKLTPSTNPSTVISDVVSVVTNISSNRLPFGFLPPHGKELAAGASVTIDGDLVAQLKTGGGRTHTRKLAGFKAAVADKLLRYYVNHRHIVTCAVDSGTVIAVGDLVWLDTDDVKPASAFTWTSDLATTQAAFALKFLGVALDAHTAGSAVTNFRVDISPVSIYAFACDSEAHEVGALLGPKKAGGNALLSTSLDIVATTPLSIARAMKRDSSATATTLVHINSAYWGGQGAQGPQGPQGAPGA
jgi:hypothetical protein